ncbi:MAG: ABC transporter ATP-binding protein [Candidatus Methanoperedens sp.]|nr:ABC transporter ATP-binding protein [Candidatus Methanoperedens sp.]MCE8429448.1 ABC transporter ATP-binding protein [Candidatus Methanoperedens sp.]
MPLLEIKDITYRVKEKEIFSGLSLEIGSKEVHAILGKNGTGKSTLAYLVMGCESYIPTSGVILFEGKIINDLKIHERAQLGITLAWQEPVRLEGISVRDYLTLKKKEIDPSLYLEMVGLSPELYLTRMMDKSLSGGERKRIELASIVALEPKLAILDEPDSGIDMLSIQDIINVINVLKKNGAAVLLITHREEIGKIADRASQICDGKIICSGDPEKVAQYYKSRKCEVCIDGACVYV